MAKSLAERINTALTNPRARIVDVETLINDVVAEHDRLQAACEKSDAESVDFALNESERDEAAEQSARYARNVKALASARDNLTARLSQKRDAEAQKALETARLEAIAERDALADRFKSEVPAAVSALTGLFELIELNAERLKHAAPGEKDAELEARDMPSNGYFKSSPIDRFTKIKIPKFADAGRAWPIDRHGIAMAEMQKNQHAALLARNEEMKPENLAKAKAAEDARWNTYTVRQTVYAGYPTGPVHHRAGSSMIYHSSQVQEFELSEGLVAAAIEGGFTVELVGASPE